VIPIFKVVHGWDLHKLFPLGGTAKFRSRCFVTQAVLGFGNVLGLKDM